MVLEDNGAAIYRNNQANGNYVEPEKGLHPSIHISFTSNLAENRRVCLKTIASNDTASVNQNKPESMPN